MQSKQIVFQGNLIIISVGDVYNRLKITDLFMYNGKLHCSCECSCGSEVPRVLVRSLLTGNTKSCGCYN